MGIAMGRASTKYGVQEVRFPLDQYRQADTPIYLWFAPAVIMVPIMKTMSAIYKPTLFIAASPQKANAPA
jgi:hypothetical protein